MKDRWTELCEQAISELDPQKFRAILRELNELLDEKEDYAALTGTAEPSNASLHSIDRPQQVTDRAA